MNMWSSAVGNLHLSDDEFYDLTPRKYDALQKRYKYTAESNELLFGQLTSWVANTGFKSCDKPTKIEDFMPSKWDSREKSDSRKDKPAQTNKRHRKVIAQEIRQAMAAFGAVTTRRK